MASEEPNYIGSTIDLLTNSAVRYKGVLFSINIEDATVTLKDVVSFGTEDRECEKKIKASDQMTQFVEFRGDEILDLSVVEDPDGGDAASAAEEKAVPAPAPAPVPTPAPAPAPQVRQQQPRRQPVATGSMPAPPPNAWGKAKPTPQQAAPQQVRQAPQQRRIPAPAPAPTPAPPPAQKPSSWAAAAKTTGGASQPVRQQQPRQQQTRRQPQSQPQRQNRPGIRQPNRSAPLPGTGNHLLKMRARGQQGAGLVVDKSSEFNFEEAFGKINMEDEKAKMMDREQGAPVIKPIYAGSGGGFFDNVATGNDMARQPRSAEQKLNTETFGATMLNDNRRYHRSKGKGQGGKGNDRNYSSGKGNYQQRNYSNQNNYGKGNQGNRGYQHGRGRGGYQQRTYHAPPRTNGTGARTQVRAGGPVVQQRQGGSQVRAGAPVVARR